VDDKKKALIELIEWYRDEWHKKDFGHTEMIKEIKAAEDDKILSLYEQIIDGWLD
jgi:hypothetical protein